MEENEENGRNEGKEIIKNSKKSLFKEDEDSSDDDNDNNNNDNSNQEVIDGIIQNNRKEEFENHLRIFSKQCKMQYEDIEHKNILNYLKNSKEQRVDEKSLLTHDTCHHIVMDLALLLQILIIVIIMMAIWFLKMRKKN